MSQSSSLPPPSATTEQSHLRITPPFPLVRWPAGTVDVPAVETFTVEQLRGEHGLWFHLVEQGPEDKVLPPDFYLREPLEVDVDDADALADFVSTWGRFSDVEDRDVSAFASFAADFMHADAVARGWLPVNADYLDRPRRRVGKELGLSGVEASRRLVHPSEVVFRVRMLRRFVSHIEQWLKFQPPNDIWTVPTGGSDWVVFRDHLNAALSAFQVNVQVLGEQPSAVSQQPTGYSAAALQMWNDLQNATYRQCDECGRLFTRQRGRAEHYSRTTGIRFHDRTCANRYTQREYRKRHKAKGKT